MGNEDKARRKGEAEILRLGGRLTGNNKIRIVLQSTEEKTSEY